MPGSSTRRHYRKNVRSSQCRGKAPKPCRKITSCRMTRTSSKRKHFCRKRKNTHRRK